jgi:predicted negative regulator of RcsB-dependent stress response
VLLGAGRVGEADEAAAAGTDAAVRPSSRRNALFIEARVAVAQGDLDGADSLCRSAAVQRYRGQGGDGLLLWGDVLLQLRRADEARAAWSLAMERDPQSESSKLAAARLANSTERSRAGS